MSTPPVIEFMRTFPVLIVSTMPQDAAGQAQLKTTLRNNAIIYAKTEGTLYYYSKTDGLIMPISGGGGGGGGGTSSGGGIVGSAVFFSGKSPGTDLMPADGALFSGADYPDGLTQFGGLYGGDGMTTFAVPDLRSYPPFHGGRWMVNIGSDARKTVRIYCGLGYYCGANNLYCGSLLPG